jgi:hypothetical protein
MVSERGNLLSTNQSWAQGHPHSWAISQSEGMMSKPSGKPYDQIERINKRRMRAMSLTAQIMQLVGRYIPDDPERDLLKDLHYELLEALERHGAEIVSDFDRQEYGLPPRGPDGWTMEEIIALEQKRLEALTRPLQMIIPGPLSRLP